MKKINLLLLLTIFSVSLFAQKAILPKATVMKAIPGKIDIQRYSAPKNLETYGDVIYADDFASGNATTLPTGWTAVDIDTYQGNNYLWKWTNVGATGPSVGSHDPAILSTSAANGWMIFDSDAYGQGSYDACLISPTINCSAYNSVALQFQELYLRWGNEATNPYGGNPTFVGFSTDGGTTWTDIELHAGFGVQDETDNPGLVMMNVSALIGGQANVKIRFRMQGLWDYWWQIDDFKVVVGPDNNVEVTNQLMSYRDEYSTGFGFAGYYSKVPLSQMMPAHFQADMWNNGNANQTNVNMLFTVKNSAGTVVHTANSDTAVLAFQDTFTAVTLIDSTFFPTVADVYTVDFEATQDQTDEVPDNNTAPSISFEAWDNNILAHDVFYSRGLSPEFYTGGAEGDFLGSEFYIRNATKLHSLSVLFDYRSNPGTTIVGKVYSYDASGARIDKIQTEAWVLDTISPGTWVTMTLNPINQGDEDVADMTPLTAGFEFYWGTDNLWIAGDNEGPHIYSLETALRLGTNWYYTSSGVPFVRMNLEGAILPPTFMTMGDTMACQNQSNQWAIHVVDPQGLPVTITKTTAPSWINSFTDLGNGWAIMSGTPTTAGKTGNFVELTASNGQNENKQYYVINVTSGSTNCRHENAPDDGVNEEILPVVSVFPNPSTGIITIQNAENANVMVYNMMGELVASIENASISQNINLSSFNAGSYIVKVVTDRAVVTEKVNLMK